jgi:hypothetical protein
MTVQRTLRARKYIAIMDFAAAKALEIGCGEPVDVNRENVQRCH